MIIIRRRDRWFVCQRQSTRFRPNDLKKSLIVGLTEGDREPHLSCMVMFGTLVCIVPDTQKKSTKICIEVLNFDVVIQFLTSTTCHNKCWPSMRCDDKYFAKANLFLGRGGKAALNLDH